MRRIAVALVATLLPILSSTACCLNYFHVQGTENADERAERSITNLTASVHTLGDTLLVEATYDQSTALYASSVETIRVVGAHYEPEQFMLELLPPVKWCVNCKHYFQEPGKYDRQSEYFHLGPLSLVVGCLPFFSCAGDRDDLYTCKNVIRGNRTGPEEHVRDLPTHYGLPLSHEPISIVTTRGRFDAMTDGNGMARFNLATVVGHNERNIQVVLRGSSASSAITAFPDERLRDPESEPATIVAVPTQPNNATTATNTHRGRSVDQQMQQSKAQMDSIVRSTACRFCGDKGPNGPHDGQPSGRCPMCGCRVNFEAPHGWAFGHLHNGKLSEF